MGLDVPNEDQIRCIPIADALLDIHRLIHEKGKCTPYLWYSNGLGSFHAFHAFHSAVLLGVALRMPIYSQQCNKFKALQGIRWHGLRSQREKLRSAITLWGLFRILCQFCFYFCLPLSALIKIQRHTTIISTTEVLCLHFHVNTILWAWLIREIKCKDYGQKDFELEQ